MLKLKGFRPKTEANGSTSTGGIDYSYDANGNQTSDPHKGITSIQYNYLNLPVLITYADGRKIEQRYDAAGTLISRWMTGDVATPSNNYYQFYIYGIQLRYNVIESVAHQEGRLFNTVNSNSGASWRYEYSISDHLGNTRLTFTDKAPFDGIIKVEDGEVLEEAHYYPFGLAMEGPWMNDAAALDNRYKFNGIERVQDFGLNVDMAMYRAYDPAIGRWWQADPIAKAWENPYAAMYNNPINWSDVLGADPEKKNGGEDPIDGGNLPVFEVRAKRVVNNPLFSIVQSYLEGVFPQNKVSWYRVNDEHFVRGSRVYGYSAQTNQYVVDVRFKGEFNSWTGSVPHMVGVFEDGSTFDMGPMVYKGNPPNLNGNSKISKFVVYVFRVLGRIYKVGKADGKRITKETKLPTRVHQQRRKLIDEFGAENVEVSINSIGETTAQATKKVETTTLSKIFKRLGYIPRGNQKSFKPKPPKKT